MTNPTLKDFKRALKLLIKWCDMGDWEIQLKIEPLEGKYGQTVIQAPYRQAIISLNPTMPVEFIYDPMMVTLCHEFAHIWLWDMHDPKAYDDNWAYNRLVERNVENVGRLLYERILKDAGF
jgi:hypothetical protein